MHVFHFSLYLEACVNVFALLTTSELQRRQGEMRDPAWSAMDFPRLSFFLRCRGVRCVTNKGKGRNDVRVAPTGFIVRMITFDDGIIQVTSIKGINFVDGVNQLSCLVPRLTTEIKFGDGINQVESIRCINCLDGFANLGRTQFL